MGLILLTYTLKTQYYSSYAYLPYLYLIILQADKHMVDMVSTHCVPLPAAMFELPWQLSDIQHDEGGSKTSISVEKDEA